jgi:hypothetical protein
MAGRVLRFFLSLSLLLAAPLCGARSRWLAEPPPAAQKAILSVAFDADTPGVLFVGTADGLYEYRPSRGAAPWRLIGLEGARVTALLYDRAAPGGALYAGTMCCGLYRLERDRRGWRGELVPQIGLRGVVDLAAHPRDPRYLFVSTSSEIWRSDRLPRTFEKLTLPEPGLHVRMILIDPASDEFIRFGTFDNRYFRSEDFGDTWQVDPTMKEYLHSLTTTPEGTSVAANIPQERTMTWRAVNILLSSDAIMSFVFHPSDAKVIYVGSFTRGFSVITRIQNRWEIRSTPLKAAPVFAVAVDPADARVIYVGGADGFYRSPDGGKTWETILGETRKMR